jgi:hypothetical protein
MKSNLGIPIYWHLSAATVLQANSSLNIQSLGGMYSAFWNGSIVELAPTTAPGSPAEGFIYYDSASHKLKVRTAAAWETITSI